MTRRERELEKVLTGEAEPADEEMRELARLADEMDAALAVEAPPARRERALFVNAAAGRKAHGLPLRFALPAATVLATLGLLAFFGRSATPGQFLFPVREALAEAGLASTPLEEVDRLLDRAAALVREAETQEELAPEAAADTALTAGLILREAEAPLNELSGEQLEQKAERLEDLSDRVADVLGETSPAAEEREEELQELREERRELLQERREEQVEGGEDSSGPGSGDDDNSGPGSDDSGGDDNSGPGSDDSGSGSDDSGSGSDDSGSGSDNSGSGSDSSGSGSSGSGSDDSSGSG